MIVVCLFIGAVILEIEDNQIPALIIGNFPDRIKLFLQLRPGFGIGQIGQIAADKLGGD